MTPPPADLAPLESVPPSAAALFGERLPLAERFAELLAVDGVRRGLIGPREPARIWSRHILNCAVLGELIAADVRVVDVGSGAGLPGLALVIHRPDLNVDLVEPLLRRVEFLAEVVDELGLSDRVRVLRGRAEDSSMVARAGGAMVVTARAVAPLDRLVRWCLPLLAPDGSLLALKGAGAAREVITHRAALRRAGASEPELLTCGTGVVEPPTAVLRLRWARATTTATRRPTDRGRAGR